MKHLLKRIFIFCLVICSVFVSACKNNDSSSTNPDNGTSGTENNDTIFYYDNKNIVIDDIKLEVSFYELMLDNNDFSLYITAKNTKTQDKYFSLDNLRIINETTKVSYEFLGSLGTSATLKYGVNTTFTTTYQLPSSIKTENYYLTFTYLNKNYIINLFETPDELRNNCSITMKMYQAKNGQAAYYTIDTLIVKEGRAYTTPYVWENDFYYCDTWYKDEGRTQQFLWGQKIEEDIVLYGIIGSNVKTTYSSGQLWVKGINHVPPSGKLIIDNQHQETIISNYSLKDNNLVKEIYLPRNLKKIYIGNFTNLNSLEKIYFAGTEAEWNAIEKNSTIPNGVQIIFNTIYN
ncbi:MAG: hypothetical protein IKJ33_00715 [Clostridia bacterium]|nr:hypothetical protein [Clostridia bacterium]